LLDRPMKECPTCHRAFKDELRYCPFDRTPMAGTRDPLIGTTIESKYRVEERVGGGGMGTVYRATHVNMGSTLAVKVLHPHLASDDLALRRFRQEARAAAQINHPNAVVVMDFGVTADTGLAYLVMEFLEGQELRQKIKGNLLGYEEMLNVMRQACWAVQAANTKGIIHRDLKPENIYLLAGDEGLERIKVLDFGIAKLKSALGEGTLTKVGTIIGTPYYMSPEQCDGADLDARSDVYSLGVIAYEILTGDVPFRAATPIEVIARQQTEVPRRPREVRPEIPAQVEAVVMKALAKKREDRHDSAGALALDLESALVAAGLVAGKTKPTPPDPLAVLGSDAETVVHDASLKSEGLAPSVDKPAAVTPHPQGQGAPALPRTPLPERAPAQRSTPPPERLPAQRSGPFPEPSVKPTRAADGSASTGPERQSPLARPVVPNNLGLEAIIPPEPEIHSSRSRRGFIIIIAGGVLLLSIIVAAAILWPIPGPDQSPVNSAAAAPTKTIRIDVAEGRADVYVNDTLVGTTPLAYRASLGTRLQLVLKQPGYKDKVVPPITVDATADSKPYLITMERAQ
jgi:serine/threonine protein kinase